MQKKQPFLQKKIGRAEKKSCNQIGIPRGGSSYSNFLRSGVSELSYSEAMGYYNSCSAVATAIDLIASAVEQIIPVIQLEDGTTTTEHDILDLINNPNGFETRDEFIGQVARNYLVTHDSYLYAEGAFNSAPSSLWAVPPQEINIQIDNSDNYPRQYNVSNGTARGNYNREILNDRWRYLDGGLRELYQIRDFTSRTIKAQSDSPLRAILMEINQILLGRQHNLALLNNGARLSLVASFDDDLDEEQQIQRKQALQSSLTGANNAGNIAVINAHDMTLQELGINNKDMDFMNLDSVATIAVAKRYGIPLPLIQNDASTFNNLQQANLQFYEQAVLPTFDKCYSGLTSLLMPRYGLDPAKNTITFDVQTIQPLKERNSEEMLSLAGLVDKGLLTINEYRNKIGVEDIEGGDEIYINANKVPLNQELFTMGDVNG